MAWIVQNIYPQVQSIKYPQSTDKSQDITAREMSWKHERIHRGLFTSHHLDLVTGCQEAFYPRICPGFTNIFAGLRIISSRTRIVPEHASWEQGYHGIIIPITREIQNREHFNLGPGTFVTRNFNSLFFAPRGPGSRHSCGVREICVFFIFPGGAACVLQSVILAVCSASAAPPSPASHHVSVLLSVHNTGDIHASVSRHPHQLLSRRRGDYMSLLKKYRG